MRQFSILTPTYNRAEYLPRIYDCLSQQDVDLEWVIVDDGSTDNTREIISGFDKSFEIKYAYQENAGKPTAHNRYMQMADSFISKMLDDDDILCPGALKSVWDYFDVNTGKFIQNCVCLSGLCQYSNGNIIGDKYPDDYIVSDHIRYIRNKFIKGDKSEFFLTDILKQYPFPIFENEKNIAPTVINTRIAFAYQTLYVNHVFEEKLFLEGGLSTQNYFIKYPHGSELVYNERSIPPFRLFHRIKHSALYIYFAKKNHKKNIFSNAKNKQIFPLGLCGYIFYLVKYSLDKYHFMKFLKRKDFKVFTTRK